MTSIRARSATFVSLAIVSWATPATAQDATAEAARRDLISQAERASDANDHARAVELLTRAEAVRSSTSLRQFLADELALTGAWLRAYVEAVQCQREAAADRHLRDRRGIRRDCARIEARARPHLAQLIVQAPADAPTLRVTLAGAEVPRSLWGVRYPVAAGTCVVEASSEDGRRFRQELTLSEGGEATVTVALSAPPPSPTPAVTPPPAPPPRVAEAPRATESPRVTEAPRVIEAPRVTTTRPFRTAGYVALGVGALGIGAGLVATVLASARASEFNAMTACGEADPARGGAGCQDAYDRVSTMQAIGVAGWVVGGVGAVVGGVLIALPGRPASAARDAQRSWWLATGPGELGLAMGARY